jgi:hypothetical protein
MPGEVMKKRPVVGRVLSSLLAEVAPAILAAEHCSRLTDEAIASGTTVIVAAGVAGAGADQSY